MPVVLTRVDDRLIHGQVVEGWLPVIQADRVVVVSDRAAGDDLQAGLMRLALPEGVALDVLTVAGAVRAFEGTPWPAERVLVLLPGVGELAALVEAGAPLGAVNIGGLHDAPGREPLTPHLSLTDGERGVLRTLEARGVTLEVRALPRETSRRLADVLAKAGKA